MRFAKVFDINGTQLLCVLQPREEDGVPELKMITYVGDACITFGNRVGGAEDSTDPADLLEQTRKMFEGFGQQQAEEAYRLAQKVVAEAREVREADAVAEQTDNESTSAPSAGDTDSDFGVRLQSVAVH